MDLNYAEKYKAGFLEEAAASGLSFVNAPPNNPIAFIKLCGPAFLVDGAYIANITITDDLNAAIRFKCDVFGKNNVRLFQHLDFETNCSENIAGPRMVHGIVFNNDECYLSYSVRLNQQYVTPPIGANGAIAFHLSPFAIEPYVGDVKTLNVNDQTIDVQLLNSGNSRVITFAEGYNYELQSNSEFEVPRFDLSVPPGGGLGRWPCPVDEEEQESAKYLASVNGAGPNEIGQIFLNCTNDCLAIEPVKGVKKELKLSANCAPCCRCADYNKVGKFIRSYAAIYAKMAKEYIRLANLYNSINEQFSGTADCCSTNNKMNARFKIWPQQNFMVQVQALMENNYKGPVCLCEAKLEIELKTGSEPLTVTEQIGGVEIGHKIESNTPLIITPLPEASYVYFKNVNPGNQINFDTPGTGRMSVGANLQGGQLPIASPCSDSDAESLPENCMEPCDGYLMLTAGFTITDPKFRRIVHVLQKNAEANNQDFDGIQLPMVLKFSYTGSGPDNPCSPCGRPVILPAINGEDGVTKFVRIGPNRKSVNPCAPLRLRNITVDNEGKYYVNFPEDTAVNVVSGATLTIKRKAYIADTQEWEGISDLTVQIPVGAETNSILLQSGSSNPLSDVPSNASGVSFTVTTTGQNMTSKCFPDPNDTTNGEDINVAASSVTYSVRL